MPLTTPTVDDVVRLARQLCALDKLKVIELLAPDLESALSSKSSGATGTPGSLDDQYQRGYEQVPEDVTELESLLPHLPIPAEKWE